MHNIRSKDEAKALFLRHEGFLGALGAFKSYGCTDVSGHQFMEQLSSVAKRDGSENSTNPDVQENGCIECRVQVRN